MSDIVLKNFGPVAQRFANVQAEDDLSSGIQSSFGLIGYKGKVWSVRYRGDEQQLMRDDGDGPRSSIEVIILKSSKTISKVWYEQGYVEGSNSAPDCFSNNGIAPEPTSAKRQSETCALCPHNQWGSRITPAGKQGKACADSKRVAVVPMQDPLNEMYGGPLLLRVPAASLQDLAMYGQKMQQMGYPYYSIATRIQFDPAESFPKFKFSAIRPLTDEEADIVATSREGHTVERILSENEFAAPGVSQAGPAQTPESVFEQPPQNQQAQQAAQPATQQGNAQSAGGFGAAAPSASGTVTNPQVNQQPDTQPETVVEEVVESDEDREARELEEQLAALKAKKAEKAKADKAKAAQQAKAGNDAAQQATAQSGSPDTTQVNGTASPSNTGQTATTAASPSDQNMASDFESNLDDMLADLLPG